jgi:hypothetical protein
MSVITFVQHNYISRITHSLFRVNSEQSLKAVSGSRLLVGTWRRLRIGGRLFVRTSEVRR